VEGRKLGVESICATLSKAGVQVAPSTYYATKSREPSARAVRDAELRPVLRSLWEDNYRVYGARKLWKAAKRAGHDVGRDQVARLMRTEGIEGVRRTKRVRTTRPDPTAARHPDLVKRDFTATRPNELWVTDLTFVPTFAGIAYVCFIIDAFSRMIVGWRVASNMRTETVLDAIEMARWSRGTQLEGLRCHSDAGSQGEINRSSQHLDQRGVQRWQPRTGAGRPAMCPRSFAGSGVLTGRFGRRCVRRDGRTRRGWCSGSSGG
jgi:putative transposase